MMTTISCDTGHCCLNVGSLLHFIVASVTDLLSRVESSMFRFTASRLCTPQVSIPNQKPEEPSGTHHSQRTSRRPVIVNLKEVRYSLPKRMTKIVALELFTAFPE